MQIIKNYPPPLSRSLKANRIVKSGTTLILFFLINTLVYSQNIDSLTRILKTAQNDTSRVRALIDLSEVLYASNPDTILPLCRNVLTIVDSKKEGLKLAEKKAYLKAKADALNNIGFFYKNHGKISKTIDLYISSLKIRQEIDDKGGIANSLINIGTIYYNQGNIPQALDYFMRCLKIQEEINNKVGIAHALNNIGLIRAEVNDGAGALDYLQRSLKIREEIKDKNGVAASLNNIGIIYDKQGEAVKAIEYYNRSLKIQEEINNRGGIASCLNNIGFIYFTKGSIDKALDCYYSCLKIQEEINNKSGECFTCANIADALLKQGKYSKALSFAERSLKIAEELKFPNNIEKASSTLSKIYAETDNWKGAYEMHVLHQQMKDSLNNEINRKTSILRGFQYEYEKKIAADSIKTVDEHNVLNAERKADSTKRNALYIGMVLFALFSLFIYKRYRVEKKQKHIIEHQKIIVDEHAKEISDSINYAERIQRSLLASTNLLDNNLSEYFVFFQPQNVVSGDFYWAVALPNNEFILVTGDSTGHGVPGAIMSMLNISCLKETIKDNYLQPSDILNNTRRLVIETLKKDGSIEGGKDGMDCVIVRFDFKNKKIAYSAANNPIWIVRKNEFLELPYDKMPVGRHDRETVSFSQKEVELEDGDMIYTLTDGMPDQFGGPKGKKFSYKKLKELLVSVAHLPAQEQKKIISSSLSNWKGSLEQVDDITLIGIRV